MWHACMALAAGISLYAFSHSAGDEQLLWAAAAFAVGCVWLVWAILLSRRALD